MSKRPVLATIAAALFFLGAPAAAERRQPAAGPPGSPVCLGGQCLSQIKVDPQRAPILFDAARHRLRARVPAYASIYKTPFSGKRIDQGAILVAAVGRRDWDAWMRGVGKHSVGFQVDSAPDDQWGGTGSGYLRVGNTFIDWSDIQGSSWRQSRIGEDITHQPHTGYSEATFLAKPAELKAIMAFYQARANGLILSPGPDQAKDARLPKEVRLPAAGTMVEPTWGASRGESGSAMKNLQTDACAGRASCVLNPNWRKLFAWNVKTRLSELRAFGRKYNIPELANLSADAPRQLDAFFSRYFGSSTHHGQSNDPHSLVRKNAIHASMLTAFVDGHQNPMESLAWGLRAKKYQSGRTGRVYPDQDSIQFYQPGQGQLYAIPDWKPGQREADLQAARDPRKNLYSPPRFDSERVTLKSFLEQLGRGMH
jgi:hypothetical protein